MNDVHKGLSTRMAECPARCLRPLYCLCRYVFNLDLQDTMTKIEPLGNALGTIQALCNFLEASPKQHALFSDTDQVRGENLKKDAEVIECPAMVMKAGKAVYRQMEHIVKALLGLFAEKDPKTYSESRTLLTTIL